MLGDGSYSAVCVPCGRNPLGAPYRNATAVEPSEGPCGKTTETSPERIAALRASCGTSLCKASPGCFANRPHTLPPPRRVRARETYCSRGPVKNHRCSHTLGARLSGQLSWKGIFDLHLPKAFFLVFTVNACLFWPLKELWYSWFFPWLRTLEGWGGGGGPQTLCKVCSCGTMRPPPGWGGPLQVGAGVTWKGPALPCPALLMMDTLV